MPKHPKRGYLDPPPPTTETDQIGRTASQVRLPGGLPHQHVATTHSAADGQVYLARCGDLLTGAQGAFLTTREAECRACQGRAAEMIEMLEALP